MASERKNKKPKKKTVKTNSPPVVKLERKGDSLELFVNFSYALPMELALWMASALTIVLTGLQAFNMFLWRESNPKVKELLKKLWAYQLKLQSYITQLTDKEERLGK